MISEDAVRRARYEKGIKALGGHPCKRKEDAKYYYSSYHIKEYNVPISSNKKVMILGRTQSYRTGYRV